MTDEELRNKALRDGFLPAYRALEEAVDELDMDWSARKPIQGERSTKVLAWRAIEAFYDAVLPGYTQRIQAEALGDAVDVIEDSDDKTDALERVQMLRQDAARAAALATPIEQRTCPVCGTSWTAAVYVCPTCGDDGAHQVVPAPTQEKS